MRIKLGVLQALQCSFQASGISHCVAIFSIPGLLNLMSLDT